MNGFLISNLLVLTTARILRDRKNDTFEFAIGTERSKINFY